ncbi:NAD-dependent epimerase/dehydratase family protein [Subtercola frigoramans]|uniref:Nucleoside-diphosphate-sugar epimerase n=1 Tax=Subtercola frigoramans TaxID=120298 RepID=A0ABS2L7Q4_9MICO|nr:NAD-dependent epimerase/dehydratase family protein [Subtercola frigoramans]MBM7473099.1 nucleoside-diphosphate-sugar epimerase [Subtercola frigoramans]
MRFFITGAGGYIGGSVAAVLTASGHDVRGLTRTADKAMILSDRGIDPVIGSLDDIDLIRRESTDAQVVISAADADHRASVRAMIDGLSGSGRALIHTSGASIVGDDARGEPGSGMVYDEETPLDVQPKKRARHAIDTMVLDSAKHGVRAAVVCPSLVYGYGRGVNPRSIQVPFLVDQARASGVVRVVGRGLNRWSTVHIDDLTDLYRLAIEAAPAGSFYFAENGESSYAEIGEAIADSLGLPGVRSWDPDEAAAQWGAARAYFTFGSNSRVRALRARRELGWNPRYGSVLQWIREEIPKDKGVNTHDS